jgi:C4-dicarboxylate-specific signal transduction histidine kinase
VSLETRFEAGLPRIAADRIQLQQVLLNLVINGCEAMESVPIGARRLIVATRTGIGAVDITVTDAGSGIPPDRLEQVFEAFVTTKPQGLGLGLSICRSIVTAHGGQLG